MAGEASVISRFALKFFEVLAAGFATAVSGFLVAHFTGIFTAPSPAALQAPAVQSQMQQPAAKLGAASPSPTAPTAAEPQSPRTAPQQDAKTSQPAAVAPQAVVGAAPRKSISADAKSADAKPEIVKPETIKPAADSKPGDAVASKPGAAQSLEARVRAALAKTSHSAAPEAPRRQTDSPANGASRVPVVTAPPRPAEAPTGAIASAPRSVDVAPRAAEIAPPRVEAAVQPQAPAMQYPAMQNPVTQSSAMQSPAPPALTPPATVEIRSQPVAGADASPPPAAQANAQTADKDRDEGPFSSITKFLRSDKPLPDDAAPRPPMPVGE